MKKSRKESVKKNTAKKKINNKKTSKSKTKKNIKSKTKKNIKSKTKKTIKSKKIIIKKKEKLISKLIKFQHSLKSRFIIKINFNPERYIQAFFDKIANTILDYKLLKAEDKKKEN